MCIRATLIDISLTILLYKVQRRRWRPYLSDQTVETNSYKLRDTNFRYLKIIITYNLSYKYTFYFTQCDSFITVGKLFCVFKSNTCETSEFSGEDPLILHGAGFDMTSREQKF